MKNYVLVRGEDGTLLGGGIYEGMWGEGFIKINRSENETVMVNISMAAAIHFFEEAPEALLNYMHVTKSGSADPPPPGVVGTSSKRLPAPEDHVQHLVDAGPPGHEPGPNGVGLADLPVPKLPRKRGRQ